MQAALVRNQDPQPLGLMPTATYEGQLSDSCTDLIIDKNLRACREILILHVTQSDASHPWRNSRRGHAPDLFTVSFQSRTRLDLSISFEVQPSQSLRHVPAVLDPHDDLL